LVKLLSPSVTGGRNVILDYFYANGWPTYTT
jgi:hypothetical protein